METELIATWQEEGTHGTQSSADRRRTAVGTTSVESLLSHTPATLL